MKKIIIFICFLYTSYVSAGAPAPQDKSSLPKTPHTFNNLTNLSIGVEWDEVFINKYIFKSNAYKLIKPITGGISIIKAKKHNDFSKFSGSYFWVDVMGLDSNNIERLVVSGVYGPGDLITDVMKLIYNLNFNDIKRIWQKVNPSEDMPMSRQRFMNLFLQNEFTGSLR